MYSVNNQGFNAKSNVSFTTALENWQMNCLRNYGNTVISKKHFDEILVNVYFYLYETKIKANVLNKEAYSEKYIKCFEYFKNHLEFILGNVVSFKFSPSIYGWDADCYIIEIK